MLRQTTNAKVLPSTSLPEACLTALLLSAALFAAIGLAGCGDACFAGFSINGNGGVIVKAGNPPPACSLMPAPVSMRVVALKSPACEACPSASRAKHLYVTVEGVQLRADSTDTVNSPNWLELVPEFATAPRQIDWMGDGNLEILVSGRNVPAGNYREIRLQFYAGTPAGLAEGTRENSCGSGGGNCVVFADGHVEAITFPEGTPELRIPISENARDALLLLPATSVEVRLRLLPERRFSASGAEGLELQTGIIGNATVFGERSQAAEDSPSR